METEARRLIAEKWGLDPTKDAEQIADIEKAIDDIRNKDDAVREKRERAEMKKPAISPDDLNRPGSNTIKTGGGFYRPQYDRAENDLHAKAIMALDSHDEGGALGDFQRLNDDLLWTSALTGRDARDLDLHKRYWRENVTLQKALNTSDTDWIPASFSNLFQQKIRGQLTIANLFTHVPMNATTLKVPYEGSDPTVYLVGTENSTITASDPGMESVTLTAKTFASRSQHSAELDEDSAIALIPQLQKQHARRLAENVEFNIVHGDAAGDALGMASNTSGGDVSNAWDGLHIWCSGNATGVDAGYTTFASGENFVAAKQLMGVWSQNAVWIMSPEVYDRLILTIDNSTNKNLILNPHGAEAAAVKGSVATLLGRPVITSPMVMNNLNSSGIYDGASTGAGVIFLVSREACLVGDRRQVLVEVNKDITTQTLDLVVTARYAFEEDIFETSQTVHEWIYGVDVMV